MASASVGIGAHQRDALNRISTWPTPQASSHLEDDASPRALRIVVADAHPATHTAYEEYLGGQGHQVCLARTGPQLVELSRVLSPDLLIACAQLPELDGLAAVEQVCRERPLPVILLCDQDDLEVIGRALANPHILAFLTKPLKPADLGLAVALAVRRFAQFEACREESETLRRTLEERKLIERAKGALMRRAGLDEADAYRRLRKLSSNRNQKLVEVAEAVLAAEETFALLEQLESSPGNGRGKSWPRNGRQMEGRSQDNDAMLPTPSPNG